MSKSVARVRLIEPKPAGLHFFSLVKLPRLGLPIMGAILKKRGHDVRIYCQDIKAIDYADLFSSDVAGISITTSTAPAGYKLADSLRDIGIPVIMGGPHATFMPDEALLHADYVVRNEGEDAIVELIDCISQRSEPAGVLGVSYKWDGRVVHNPCRPFAEDLDAFPFPDLDLIQGAGRIRVKPVQTSRGCPYGCVFCSVTGMFGRKYRFRSCESIVEELKNYRGRQVFFYDDNFAVNRTRAKELCEGIIRADLRINWSSQVRVDIGEDEELLELLRRSGCSMMYIGLESINPATLSALGKGQSVGQIEDCIRRLHEHKIMVHGMFISGADDDVPQVIRNTARFALDKRIDTIQVSTLTPLPGSELYNRMEREGRIMTRDWELYDGNHVVFAPANMSPSTLYDETLRALKRFYAPLQVWKLLLNFRFAIAFLRYYGYRQTRKWEAANRDFAKWTQAVGKRAREICLAMKTANNPSK